MLLWPCLLIHFFPWANPDPLSNREPRGCWIVGEKKKRKLKQAKNKHNSSWPSYFSVRFTLESRTQTTATISKRVKGKRASFLKEKKSLIFSFLLQDRVIFNCKLWISDSIVQFVSICFLTMILIMLLHLSVNMHAMIGQFSETYFTRRPVNFTSSFWFHEENIESWRLFAILVANHIFSCLAFDVSIIKGRSAWIENFTLFKTLK